ncbi:AIM24 family protein [Paenibacillus campi]|uniref:AIM24 family protein n=1 Tax=Paenibacillus campi TaxID=3106031 RepID=UPI002AFFD28A|nr:MULTISPECIES: AIM24 family protein [unclassified Paenibacillus]
MGFRINNLTDNSNTVIHEKLGGFTVLEYIKDLSCTSVMDATAQYYMSHSNMRRKQLMIELNNSEIMMRAGAMQYMMGQLEMTTGIQSLGGAVSSIFKSAASGTGAIKPHYRGTGTIMLEPTYNYIWLIDVDNDEVVIEDGLFLACETSLKIGVTARSNFSSAALGGEGLFNMTARGKGVLALEAPVPAEETVVVELENDELKVDGNFAMMWSNSLKFTVEKSGKTKFGSAASGEGLVNVYRGTGSVWLSPLAPYN